MPDVIERDIKFRLPTEQEREYACRAGATGDYCKLADGTEITEESLAEVAWFDEDYAAGPHPVGQKKPNAFGLYDMNGNVEEWTSTFNRELLGDIYLHVHRGGFWFAPAESCRYYRGIGRDVSSYRRDFLGFRLCTSLTPKERNAREEREAAECKAVAEAKAKDPAVNLTVEGILASMVDIPGKDCKMGKTEVTQVQWKAIMGENPSRFQGENNPVEQVSWGDCQEFLKLLNSVPTIKASGLTFRLPKDSEWEYACRAGATGKYCKLANGTEISEITLDQVAWFKDNSDGQTHPVGQKQPNAFGLYDMHGNVHEWTSTAVGMYRVDCGGGWGYSARFCGSSIRFRYSPSDRRNSLGIRLCADKK